MKAKEGNRRKRRQEKKRKQDKGLEAKGKIREQKTTEETEFTT